MNREAASPIIEKHPDELPVPRRYWSAAAIWLALAMAVLDGSIANVALPTIAHDLGASPATSVWIVNAYQLTITILLLPLAAYGDRCGYRTGGLRGAAAPARRGFSRRPTCSGADISRRSRGAGARSGDVC